MKEVFFTFLAIALPVFAFGGVIYMFAHGVYHVVEDWRLSREMRNLGRQAAEARRNRPPHRDPSFDPLAAFDDEPRSPEPDGILTMPLDPDWSPMTPASTEHDSAANEVQAPIPADDATVVNPSAAVAETLPYVTPPDRSPPDDPHASEPPLSETPVAEEAVIESPVVESPVVESPVVESPVVEIEDVAGVVDVTTSAGHVDSREMMSSMEDVSGEQEEAIAEDVWEEAPAEVSSSEVSEAEVSSSEVSEEEVSSSEVSEEEVREVEVADVEVAEEEVAEEEVVEVEATEEGDGEEVPDVEAAEVEAAEEGVVDETPSVSIPSLAETWAYSEGPKSDEEDRLESQASSDTDSVEIGADDEAASEAHVEHENPVEPVDQAPVDQTPVDQEDDDWSHRTFD